MCTPRIGPWSPCLVLVFVVAMGRGWSQEAPRFIRGDVDASGVIDITDPISLLGCLFLGSACPRCPDSADSNDDGRLDLSDSVFTLSWLFLGGAVPPEPGPTDCGADPTDDSLDSCVFAQTVCPPVVEEDPTLADVLSRLHYASVAEPSDEVELEDESDGRPVGEFPLREVPYDPRPGPGFSWNSAEGRRILEAEFGGFFPDEEGARAHSAGSVEQQILSAGEGPVCVEPDYYVEASDRTFSAWPGIKLQPPGTAFATKTEARNFLRKIHAEQPFFLPYTHPDVKLGGGWYYSNGGGLHRACDYSRSGVEEDEDPTFMVKSSGAGTVVAVFWDHNAGNTVAVEHTAPGGQKVLILYMHLRNGKSNDIANAKSSTSTADKYVKYRAFATDYPDHVSWGTDDHTLRVSVHDTLKAGDEIGYAGNTGAGGAGNGLNADGSPTSWKGNVHLHVYWGVPHPTVMNAWVLVDPYGVYDRVDGGCYDLLKDTEFSRLYAPFYPTFHGVPFEVVDYYAGYYPNMGRSLRTLSVHRKGQKLVVSGSFQSGIPGQWAAFGYMTPQEFQAKADQLLEGGLIMRETSVEKTLSGNPRYTAIWREIADGEQIEHRGALTDAEWSDLWDERVIDDEWRLEDYFGYRVGGTSYHSVLVTSREGRPFVFSGLKTSSQLDDLVDEYAADGFLPVHVNVADLAQGRRYSGIFRKVPGCWKVYWGRTPSQYQSLVSDQISKGYRVWKVEGYADSTRYAVIVQRDPDGGPCP